jgi:hypothetical protein
MREMTRTATRCWVTGARAQGADARPLDGSALTQWGARALARGPAVAPHSSGCLAQPPCHHLRTPSAREKRGGESEMSLGLGGGASGVGFCAAKSCRRPSITIRQPAVSGPTLGPSGKKLSRPRPRLRPGTREQRNAIGSWAC